LIPYSRQTVSFFDALYVARQIKFKSLTQGLKIDNFEEKVAKYVGAKFGRDIANELQNRMTVVIPMPIHPPTAQMQHTARIAMV
jgi:hypothetical protein